MNKSILGRFAPSPSGYMHLGNLLSMLLAWLDARALGGSVLFRMEDLDPARSKSVYTDMIADDLRWLGLTWDTGYPAPAFSQSQRTVLYESSFEKLRDRGLVYPCFCSRAERLAASAPHPGELTHDPGCRCAHLSEAERQSLLQQGKKPAWKLRVPNEDLSFVDAHYGTFTQNLAQDGGDFIVRRSDGVFAYQFAVSYDDAVMGVSRVVRGRDLLTSTAKQIYLIRLLGYDAPTYAHGPLLIQGDGKMSKRLGSLSTQELRKDHTPEQLIGKLSYAAGLIEAYEPVSAAELIPHFDWNKVRKEDIPYD